MSLECLTPERDYADRYELCQLMGTSIAASGVDNSAIIYHGIGGCRTMMEYSRLDNIVAGGTPTPIYASNATQADVIYGGGKKLEQCINFFLPQMQKRKFKVIWLITSCATSMICDDINAPAQRVEEATGSRVIPMDTPGFQGGLYTGADRTYAALLESFAGKGGEKLKGSVNIIAPQFMGSKNWPWDLEEMVHLLEAADVNVNCVLTCRSKSEDLRGFARAEANYILTPEEMPLFNERSLGLGVERWGQDLVLPMGMANTEEWYLSVASRFGDEEKAKEQMEKDAALVTKRLKGDYTATWVLEDSFAKRVGVIGAAPYAAAVARYLYYDLNMRPVVVALIGETPQAIETSKQLLSDMGERLDIQLLENPTYLEYGQAVRDAGVSFTIGQRHDRVLSEGMKIPHLSWGGLTFMNQTNFIPWPTYGIRGTLSLLSEIALVLEEAKYEKSGWISGSLIPPLGQVSGEKVD